MKLCGGHSDLPENALEPESARNKNCCRVPNEDPPRRIRRIRFRSTGTLFHAVLFGLPRRDYISVPSLTYASLDVVRLCLRKHSAEMAKTDCSQPWYFLPRLFFFQAGSLRILGTVGFRYLEIFFCLRGILYEKRGVLGVTKSGNSRWAFRVQTKCANPWIMAFHRFPWRSRTEYLFIRSLYKLVINFFCIDARFLFRREIIRSKMEMKSAFPESEESSLVEEPSSLIFAQTSGGRKIKWEESRVGS